VPAFYEKAYALTPNYYPITKAMVDCELDPKRNRAVKRLQLTSRSLSSAKRPSTGRAAGRLRKASRRDWSLLCSPAQAGSGIALSCACSRRAATQGRGRLRLGRRRGAALRRGRRRSQIARGALAAKSGGWTNDRGVAGSHLHYRVHVEGRGRRCRFGGETEAGLRSAGHHHGDRRRDVGVVPSQREAPPHERRLQRGRLPHRRAFRRFPQWGDRDAGLALRAAVFGRESLERSGP
jgi:hypothetical protein